MKTLTKIYFRSFLLQAVWNYEKMQNIGFLFSILPQLKKLYKNDADKLKDGCKRHMNYFNTHPYMASIVLGCAAKLEEKIKEDGSEAVLNLHRTKLQLSGPLAALGDKVFWSTWKPVVGLLGVLMVLAGVKPYYIIPLGFIFLYNIVIIPQRGKLIDYAYDSIGKVMDNIKRADNQFVLNYLPAGGLIIVGICLITAFIQWGYLRGGLLLGFTCAVIILRRCCNISATILLYMISLITILGNLVF